MTVNCCTLGNAWSPTWISAIQATCFGSIVPAAGRRRTFLWFQLSLVCLLAYLKIMHRARCMHTGPAVIVVLVECLSYIRVPVYFLYWKLCRLIFLLWIKVWWDEFLLCHLEDDNGTLLYWYIYRIFLEGNAKVQLFTTRVSRTGINYPRHYVTNSNNIRRSKIRNLKSRKSSTCIFHFPIPKVSEIHLNGSRNKLSIQTKIFKHTETRFMRNINFSKIIHDNCPTLNYRLTSALYGHVSWLVQLVMGRDLSRPGHETGRGLSVQFVLSADSPRIRQVSARPLLERVSSEAISEMFSSNWKRTYPGYIVPGKLSLDGTRLAKIIQD